MKTKSSLQRSFDGCRKQAVRKAEAIAKDLLRLESATSLPQEGLHLGHLRLDVTDLCQRVHEMNAYWNALNTD